MLAGISFGACVLLAFIRPDGGWEWVPALVGLGVFGILGGRRVTRVPFHSAGLALSLTLLIPGYHIISGINRGKTLNVPELAIDRAIEVEPVWMLAYGSVFLFAFLPVFVVRGAELTRRVLWTYIVVELLAFVGFILYPTGLERPVVSDGGFFPWTLQLIYAVDPPRNCFPSLHVAWAFVAALSCYRVHRRVGAAALVWATLIAVSTLYTKQHYLVDVLAGIAIAVVGYAVFLHGYHRDRVAASDVRLAPMRATRAVWIYALVILVGVAAYLLR